MELFNTQLSFQVQNTDISKILSESSLSPCPFNKVYRVQFVIIFASYRCLADLFPLLNLGIKQKIAAAVFSKLKRNFVHIHRDQHLVLIHFTAFSSFSSPLHPKDTLHS